MKTASSNTFGAKLRRAQDVLTYVSGFTGYNPPRQQESVEGFTALLDSIIAINATDSSHQENYKIALDLRHAAFMEKTDSVIKMLAPIKGAVEAQFGRNSSEVVTVLAIAKKMRSHKLVKASVDPAVPEETISYSKSELSYGAMTQYFNSIVSTLTQFPNFDPTNPSLKIAALEAFSADLTAMNNSVIQKTLLLKTAKSNRLALYADLTDRVQRIKSYVRAQYGTTSNEFSIIKNFTL